jgi:hypothetical protein
MTDAAKLIISEMLINQELARMGGRGYGDGLNSGMVIGLPPILNFAKEPLRSQVLEEVFSGQKVSILSWRFSSVQLTYRSFPSPFPRRSPDQMFLVFELPLPSRKMARAGSSMVPRSGLLEECTRTTLPSAPRYVRYVATRADNRPMGD